jgi:hypothetical protein
MNRATLARAVRACALHLWRLADRIHQPGDDWQDDDGAYGDQFQDDPDHDTAHPVWQEGCHGCQDRADRKEQQHRATAYAAHPSNRARNVVSIVPRYTTPGGDTAL